jgi:hypothetical protein
MRAAARRADNLYYTVSACIPACSGMTSASRRSLGRRRTRKPSKHPGLDPYQARARCREATSRTSLLHHRIRKADSLTARPYLAAAAFHCNHGLPRRSFIDRTIPTLRLCRAAASYARYFSVRRARSLRIYKSKTHASKIQRGITREKNWRPKAGESHQATSRRALVFSFRLFRLDLYASLSAG